MMQMPGVAVVRYPVPDCQHQEGCFWKCLLLGMLWPGCLAQHHAVVAITPMRLFRVVFGMSKQMAASLRLGKEKLWLRDGLWVFSWLSYVATQQLLRISLAWGDPVLCHVKGCGRTFAGLALAVASCLAVADMLPPALAQILGSLNEIFSVGSTHC